MPELTLEEFDGNVIDGLEFCAKVYALFEAVRNAPDGPSRLRMRPSRLEKKLLEELLPICQYIQASYRTGRYISIRWQDGNQQFDAELHQRGAYVTESYYPASAFLEVTCVMHPNEHMSRELLEKNGIAFGVNGIHRLKNGELVSNPIGYTNKDFVDSYSALVLKELNKKVAKPYPENTTLIVQCTLNTIYMSDEWSMLMSRVAADLPHSNFREIYFYDPTSMRSHTMHPLKDP